MILLISYDLLVHERPSSYDDVRAAIEEQAGDGNFIKALYSQFLVDTTETADLWDQLLDTVTDDNDCWLISEVTENRAGTLPSEAVAWLTAHT